MRIAISLETNDGLDSVVSHHFGRCPHFALVDMDGAEVQAVKVIDNPFFASHQPGQVPGFIHEQEADVMLSGGMGWRAIQFFEQFGIKAATGATGTVRATLENYLDGKLSDASPCSDSLKHGKDHDHHDH